MLISILLTISFFLTVGGVYYIILWRVQRNERDTTPDKDKAFWCFSLGLTLNTIILLLHL